MVELIRKIESKHQEYILWLESQKDDFEIGGFISYVTEKKANYRHFVDTCQISYIDELPRSINRYLDEYFVDYNFTKRSNKFTNELSILIDKLKRDYSA